MIDMRNVSTLEIVIEKQSDGNYKVWVNTTAGCALRAYNVEIVSIVSNGKEIEHD